MEPPKIILRSAALRLIEARQRDAVPALMERAGAAAARLARELINGSALPPLVVAGPGNNGGDALVAARLLRQSGLDPVVVAARDSAKRPADARAAQEAWIAAGGVLHDDIPDARFSLAIDGLLGIGATGQAARPLAGRLAQGVAKINELDCPVLALDVPSGLDADTGRVLGIAVRASHTLSFIALKPGLLTLDGPDHCGAIAVDALGLPLDSSQNPDAGLSVAPALFAEQLKPRRRNSHKGSFGSAGIIGGAPGMAGAALLAARAALHLGAGRVYLGMLQNLAVDLAQPELMLRSPGEVFESATCLAVGPGLGLSAAAAELTRRAIAAPLPLLLDADALNLLAAHPALARSLAKRAAPALLTPHPAEAARLLGCTIDAIQDDRIGAALNLARRMNAGVVLKGCGSVIAFADGRWFINTSGNPGLAGAGSGDVLTGMAAALLAQGWPAEQALLAAVHLHGLAAEALAAAGEGPIGLSASELPAHARRLLNGWSHA